MVNDVLDTIAVHPIDDVSFSFMYNAVSGKTRTVVAVKGRSLNLILKAAPHYFLFDASPTNLETLEQTMITIKRMQRNPDRSNSDVPAKRTMSIF